MKRAIRHLQQIKDPKTFVENALFALLIGTLIGSLAAFIHAAL